MRGVDRRAQILSMAEDLFAEHGFLEVTMDQVAAAAGVTKPIVYGHFGSKDGLLLAIIGRARTDLLAAMATAADGQTAPAEVLRIGILEFFRFVDDNHAAWKLLSRDAAKISGGSGEELKALRQAQADLTTDLILDLATGVSRQEAEAFAEIIIGACDALALWRDGRPTITPEVVTDHAMTVLWHGLASRV